MKSRSRALARPQSRLRLALLLIALVALRLSMGCASSPPADSGDHDDAARDPDLAVAAAPPVSPPTDLAATTDLAGGAPAGTDLAATPSSPATGPSIAGCPMFPADNAWNQDISQAPLHANSAAYVASIGAQTAFHPDWSSTSLNAPHGYGIPFVVVPGTQPKVPIQFVSYPTEADPGPYPIPNDIPIEGGPNATGDRHGIMLDSTSCYAYEVFQLARVGNTWQGAAGAIWRLRENWTRPERWTSADAAGLPVLPGLVRYDEVAAGEIRHALRFTITRSQRAYIAPASHFASSSTESSRPPMGLRVRLKASVDETRFPARMQVIVRALKRYGMFVADNGGDWFVQGAPDPRWDDGEIETLKQLRGSDFEAVDTGPIVN